MAVIAAPQRLQLRQERRLKRSRFFSPPHTSLLVNAVSPLVVVYHPGSQPVTSEFFDEPLVLLERLAVIDAPLYIIGDLNIRLGRADDPHTIQLRSTFDAYGFRVNES